MKDRFKIALWMGASCIAFSHPAFAQSDTAAAPDDSGQIAEIIVTAQKRAQNLQNVPVAVSAVTSKQLETSGVNDLIDLKFAVPTLNLTNSVGYLTTSLRGVGSNGVGPAVENPIATYIDGVYYGSPAASLLTLNNVAQVEVLKGPQGTLFGRNATGGLIQIFTKDPTSTPSGEFNIRYGNYQTLNVNGYVSGGLGEMIAADLAVAYSTQGRGWGRSLTTGDDVYKIDHDFAVRSKWILEPTDDTKITIIGDYADSRNSMSSFAMFPGTVNGLFPTGPSPDTGYDTTTDFTNEITSESGGASLRVEQQLGELTLTSTTALRRATSQFDFDYDFTPFQIQSISAKQKDRQFSQEVQLNSAASGKLTWVLGAFYYNATSGYAPFDLFAHALSTQITVNAKQRTRSLAGYAQGTYEILPDTNLTLGGRYTSDKRKTFAGSTTFITDPAGLGAILGIFPPTGVYPAPDTKAKFNKFSFRVSLDHRFSNEVMAYASFNRGFKGGGFTTAQPGTAPYLPENIDAIEVGLKTDLLDRRLRINIAGFHYDYSNIQIQILRNGSIGIINGPSAKIYGLDMDVQAIISPQFRISGGLGWTHAHFGAFGPIPGVPDSGCQKGTPLGGTPVLTGQSCSGNQLPLASDILANLAIDYKVPLAGGSLNFNGNLYYNSGFYPEADNVVKQSGYAMLGANIRWTSGDEHFNVGVFGKNLTNERVIQFESTTAQGTHSGFYQAPRTYGVSLGYNF